MNKQYKGSCLCGVVTFSVEGFSDLAANCHCTMCRKFHGAAYGTLVGVSAFKWLSGSESLKYYVALNGTTRTFCQECGSSLGFQEKDAPLSEIEVAISTFDEEIPVVTDAHIFTNYKAHWCKLNDDLPRFGEGRDSEEIK